MVVVAKETVQDQVTGMVFVDFRNAFDVVDHQILIKKLKLVHRL